MPFAIFVQILTVSRSQLASPQRIVSQPMNLFGIKANISGRRDNNDQSAGDHGKLIFSLDSPASTEPPWIDRELHSNANHKRGKFETSIQAPE